MPLCYGGGIKTIAQIKQIISLGVEKISLSSIILSNPEFIMEAIEQVGSQSIVVTLDISKGGLFNKETIFTQWDKIHKLDLFSFLKKLKAMGLENVINSINDDGLMNGYNKKLVESISTRTNIPLTFLGGAGKLDHIKSLWEIDKTVGAAAGSLFVFKGKLKPFIVSLKETKQALYPKETN